MSVMYWVVLVNGEKFYYPSSYWTKEEALLDAGEGAVLDPEMDHVFS